MSLASPPLKIVFLDRATLSPRTVLKPFAFPHALRTFERTAASEVAAFARMTRRPLVINTARGRLADEVALVDALQSGQISGAGFDVVTEEPLPAGHPFHAILSHPGFILTPHVGWASDGAVQALADQLVENVAAFQGGAPRNVVTAS